MRRRLSAFYLMLVCGTLWAAGDPMVGKWKVNPAKCKIIDEMKVEALGGNKYAITFGPGAVDTIVADGTDQPLRRGLVPKPSGHRQSAAIMGTVADNEY